MTTTSNETYYIVITGMQLKSIVSFPRFALHAIPSMNQARNAVGNISADGNYVNGVHHTLSVWKDRKSMTKFMASGAHAKAMKVEPIIAIPDTTKTYGYESETIPTWDEAIAIWTQHAQAHGRPRKSTRQKASKSTANNNLIGRGSLPSILALTCLVCVVGFVGLLSVAANNNEPVSVHLLAYMYNQ